MRDGWDTTSCGVHVSVWFVMVDVSDGDHIPLMFHDNSLQVREIIKQILSIQTANFQHLVPNIFFLNYCIWCYLYRLSLYLGWVSLEFSEPEKCGYNIAVSKHKKTWHPYEIIFGIYNVKTTFHTKNYHTWLPCQHNHINDDICFVVRDFHADPNLPVIARPSLTRRLVQADVSVRI